LGSSEARREFALSALQAFADCTPLRLSPDFAAVAARRVLTIRLVQKAKSATHI
jgi:hypothetical protein